MKAGRLFLSLGLCCALVIYLGCNGNGNGGCSEEESLEAGNCDDGIDNDCDGLVDVDDECVMALVPAGCYDMGDHFNEGDSDELPVHNVCISAFRMDLHEVTNAEYAECVDAGVCTGPSDTSSYSRVPYYGDPAYDDFPVIFVDWYQAEDYCSWAGKRIPTEAEWEYAARGGWPGMRYPWGDAIDCDDACYGRWTQYYPCWDHWHNGTTDNDTHPVGNYAANDYGLFDMAGNVWEWTNDWYQDDYYSDSPQNDPQGPASGTYRVLRGGGWKWTEYRLRVANRGSSSPLGAYDNGGFRCVR